MLQPQDLCEAAALENKMVRRKRPVVWIIPLLIGLSAFYRVMNSTRVELYRTVDIVQLLAAGMCFGAALVGIILAIRKS